MKLFGQVDVKTILTGLALAGVSSGATFITTKGSIAVGYETEQAAQRRELERLARRDLEREAEAVNLRAVVVAQDAKVEKHLARTEASVEEIKKLVKQALAER